MFGPLSSPVRRSTRHPAVPEPPMDTTSVQRRQAALQKCGLVPPPRKDLPWDGSVNRRRTDPVFAESGSPPLSPAVTASRFSSTSTLFDEESGEKMDTMTTHSSSGKSQFSQLEKASDASLGLEMVREMVPQPTMPAATPILPPSEQKPSIRMRNRGSMVDELEKIEDDESRRLTELAFIGY